MAGAQVFSQAQLDEFDLDRVSGVLLTAPQLSGGLTSRWQSSVQAMQLMVNNGQGLATLSALLERR